MQFLEKLQGKDYFHAWLGQHLTAPLRYRQRSPSPFFLQPAAVAAKTPDEIAKEVVEDNARSGSAESEENDEHDYDVEEDYEEADTTLPFAVRSTHSVALPTVFADAAAVLQAVLKGECALRRAEGLRAAYVEDVLYIDGEVRVRYFLAVSRSLILKLFIYSLLHL